MSIRQFPDHEPQTVHEELGYPHPGVEYWDRQIADMKGETENLEKWIAWAKRQKEIAEGLYGRT